MTRSATLQPGAAAMGQLASSETDNSCCHSASFGVGHGSNSQLL